MHDTWLCFLGLAVLPSMAMWRDQNADTVREVIKAVRCCLGGADLSHQEAADMVGMDKGLWARVLAGGGNFAALVVLARRNPAISREMRVRLIDLLTPREAMKCDTATASDSSSESSAA